MADQHPTADWLLEPILDAHIDPVYKENLGAVIREAHRACEGDRDLMIKALVGAIAIVASSVGPSHGPDAVDIVMRHCIDVIETTRLKLALYVGSVTAPPRGEPS